MHNLENVLTDCNCKFTTNIKNLTFVPIEETC